MRPQIELLARKVSSLDGIRWGRRHLLGHFLGLVVRRQRSAVVVKHVVGTAQATLCYSFHDIPKKYSCRSAPIDVQPRQVHVNKRRVDHLPAKGLGPAGRVSLAQSLWRKCVPRGLRAVYRRRTKTFSYWGAARYFCAAAPFCACLHRFTLSFVA